MVEEEPKIKAIEGGKSGFCVTHSDRALFSHFAYDHRAMLGRSGLRPLHGGLDVLLLPPEEEPQREEARTGSALGLPHPSEAHSCEEPGWNHDALLEEESESDGTVEDATGSKWVGMGEVWVNW